MVAILAPRQDRVFSTESVGDLDTVVNVLSPYYEKSWNVTGLKAGIIFDRHTQI